MDRPIIFSAPMVKALLDGRKTQTRRIVSPRNTRFDGGSWPKGRFEHCKWDGAWVDAGPSPAGNPGPYLKVEYPYQDDETLVSRVYPMMQPGDRLYVREACCWVSAWGWRYKADNDDLTEQREDGRVSRWRSPIHMPRLASRLTLSVTDVQVQRLQDISEADAIAEGCLMDPEPDEHGGHMPAEIAHERGGDIGWDCARDWYADLWNSLHGPDAWDANPWVVAVSFDVIRGNIDA